MALKKIPETGRWVSLPPEYKRKYKSKLNDILADGIKFMKEHKIKPIPMYECHIRMGNGKLRKFFMTYSSKKFYIKWEVVPDSLEIIDVS